MAEQSGPDDRRQVVEGILREAGELLDAVRGFDPAPLLAAADAIVGALRSNGKVLTFGNGGSASDAEHLAAELVGRFARERRGWPAIALTADSSVVTSIGNDLGFDQIFARQVEALGAPGDVAVAISTSGSSAPEISARNFCSSRAACRSDGEALSDSAMAYSDLPSAVRWMSLACKGTPPMRNITMDSRTS